MEPITIDSTTSNQFSYKQKALFVVLGVVLYVSGLVTYPLLEQNLFHRQEKTDSSSASDKRTYEEGFNDAKKLVDESGIYSLIQSQNKKKELSGIVTTITGDKVSFHDSSIKNPFEKITRDYTAVINEKTLIFKSIYENSTSTTLKSMPVALNVSRLKVSLADIKTGDLIIVTSKDEVKDTTEFVANGVLIQGPIVTP